MKTSLVLFQQTVLEKYPYLQYIYNAIIDKYMAKGACKKVDFQEAGFQKIAGQAGRLSLLLIELPGNDSLKKGLWEKINYPALVKQLRPENIFYLGEYLPILKDAKGARQWSFVPDLRKISLPAGARAGAVKKQQRLLRALLLTDRIVSYSPAAADAVQVQLPAAASKLVAWLPVPDQQYLDPSLYTDELADAFRQSNTDDEAYFLIDARASAEPAIIEYLKAFSHFKKWQRSAMRLALFIAPNMHRDADFMEKFDSYFYREDVHLLSEPDTKILYRWVHAAYGVVTPYTGDEGLDLQLAAARLGTLIIAPETSTSALLLPKAIYALTAIDKASLGQVLVSSYKSEILRDRHIRAGSTSVGQWEQYVLPDY